MEKVKKVFDKIKNLAEPENAGKVAEASGIDRKEVEKAMKKLKEEGRLVSPK